MLLLTVDLSKCKICHDNCFSDVRCSIVLLEMLKDAIILDISRLVRACMRQILVDSAQRMVLTVHLLMVWMICDSQSMIATTWKECWMDRRGLMMDRVICYLRAWRKICCTMKIRCGMASFVIIFFTFSVFLVKVIRKNIVDDKADDESSCLESCCITI